MDTYFGTIQDNGQIHIDGDLDLPAGTRVQITIVNQEFETRGITVEELLKAPFIGEWADRDDIGDTAEFAEELRRRSQKRTYDDD